jgi:peroxiredoxin
MATRNDDLSALPRVGVEARGRAPRPVIRRHGPVTAAVRMPLAGAWIAARFMLMPALWVPFKLGSRMRWAFTVDSFMKRAIFPLTERPDNALQNDLGPPAVRAMPGVRVRQGARTIDLAEVANGRRVLLVVFRGSWCPYSRLHLSDLATVQRSLDELGVTIIAVSAHADEAWWRSKGVDFVFAADPDGELFRALGVQQEPSLAQQTWGMLLPHESVFLFERGGALVASDVRRLDSTKTQQAFLSATKWLEIARALPPDGAAERQAGT